jgi:hypothetical protein
LHSKGLSANAEAETTISDTASIFFIVIAPSRHDQVTLMYREINPGIGFNTVPPVIGVTYLEETESASFEISWHGPTGGDASRQPTSTVRHSRSR